MADISKITLPSGSTYNIKDAVARSHIQALTAGGVTYIKESVLPAPTSKTMGNIYLVPHDGKTNDVYDEYLTVENDGAYTWQLIGNTAVELDGYAKAGDSVTITQGTAASKATGVSVSDHTVTQGDVSLSSKYTPTGQNEASNVTFSGSTNIYSMTSAGSVTQGTAPSLTNGTLAAFTATVQDETLTLGWTAPTHDTLNAGTVPPIVTLPTRSSVIAALTTSTTATAAAQKFTGSETTISMSGKTTGVAVSAHSVTDSGHTHTVTGTGTIDG